MQAALRRRPRGARLFVVLWCATLFTVDVASGWLALHGTHNLWLTYILMPVSVALAVWALSLWQTSELWRLTFRVGIIPLMLAWAVLALVVENTSTFSSAANPMLKLVALAAAAYTLLARSLASRGDLLRHDWFWVTSGLALYYGAGVTLEPASALLAKGDYAVFMRLLNAWAVAGILALFLIAKGMACPTDR